MPAIVVSPLSRIAEVAVKHDNAPVEWNKIPWSTAFYKQHGYMVPPDGWDLLKKHDAPTTVRKDTDKRKTDQPSRFVQFVSALQEGFSAEYRRGVHSHVALADAIVKARSGRKNRHA